MTNISKRFYSFKGNGLINKCDAVSILLLLAHKQIYFKVTYLINKAEFSVKLKAFRYWS